MRLGVCAFSNQRISLFAGSTRDDLSRDNEPYREHGCMVSRLRLSIIGNDQKFKYFARISIYNIYIDK